MTRNPRCLVRNTASRHPRAHSSCNVVPNMNAAPPQEIPSERGRFDAPGASPYLVIHRCSNPHPLLRRMFAENLLPCRTRNISSFDGEPTSCWCNTLSQYQSFRIHNKRPDGRIPPAHDRFLEASLGEMLLFFMNFRNREQSEFASAGMRRGIYFTDFVGWGGAVYQRVSAKASSQMCSV